MSQPGPQSPGDAFRRTAALWLTGHRDPEGFAPGRRAAVDRAAVSLDLLRPVLELPPARRLDLLTGARRELTKFLAGGLELRIGSRERVGQRLTSSAPPPGVAVLWRPEPGPLDIYRALRASGVEPPAGLNVCEECDTVFRSRKARASKCPRCHRSPRPQPELRPWHLASHAQETFDPHTGEPTGWSVGYTATCQACEARFHSSDARQYHCANCGAGAGRKRRHRGSSSTRGRKRFRFEGPPNLSGVSVALPDGSSAELHIEGRIVETSDAEAAKALEHFPNLRCI